VRRRLVASGRKKRLSWIEADGRIQFDQHGMPVVDK